MNITFYCTETTHTNATAAEAAGSNIDQLVDNQEQQSTQSETEQMETNEAEDRREIESDSASINIDHTNENQSLLDTVPSTSADINTAFDIATQHST